MSPELKAQSLGLSSRPLGPAVGEHTSTDDLYRAIIDRQPYGVRGLVVFGANLLMAHADGRRGRKALAALDFYVHADLFMKPTAELADIVLPVATPFETGALKIGFEVSAAAQVHVQLRKRLWHRKARPVPMCKSSLILPAAWALADISGMAISTPPIATNLPPAALPSKP
jgi:anaerobic selenocysteine-containing dehydrogenase